MKLTKKRLQQIIKEESARLDEAKSHPELLHAAVQNLYDAQQTLGNNNPDAHQLIEDAISKITLVEQELVLSALGPRTKKPI